MGRSHQPLSKGNLVLHVSPQLQEAIRLRQALSMEFLLRQAIYWPGTVSAWWMVSFPHSTHLKWALTNLIDVFQ